MRVWLAAGFVAFGAWASACGAFALNDVVPYPDAALSDGASHDGTGRDGQMNDAGGDASVPCDAAATPCSCLQTPAVLTAGVGKIIAFTIDPTYAYWAAPIQGSNPAVYRIPLASSDAGIPERLLASYSIGSSTDFAVDPFGVYVDEGNTQPRIARVPLDGGALAALTPVLPLLAIDVRVTPTAMYWTNYEAAVCVAALDGSLPPGDSGCGGKPLAPAASTDASSVSNQLAIDDASAYVAVEFTGEVRRVPLGGGAVSVVVDGGGAAQSRLIAASQGQLLWSTPLKDGGLITVAASDGSNPQVIAFPSALQAFAVDDSDVYYIDGDGLERHIYRVSRSGGSPTLLACDQETPGFIAVDELRVYWADLANDQIYSLPK